MILTGISIEEGKLAACLKAIGAFTALKGMAGNASLFDEESTRLLVQGAAAKCLLTYNILPNNAADLLEMMAQKGTLPELFGRLCREMGGIHQASECSLFTLDLSLDRYQEAQWPTQSMRFQPLLATLVSAPLPFDFSILLPVSLPEAFPGSQELARSVELCKAVKEMPRENWDERYGIDERPPLLPRTSLGLCVHAHLDKDIAPEQLCGRDILPLVKAIVFHYDVTAFETLYDDEQARWAEYLKDGGYEGVVLFAPSGCPEARLAEICQDAAAWAELY